MRCVLCALCCALCAVRCAVCALRRQAASALGVCCARRLRRLMLGLCGARRSRPGCCGARLLQRLVALALSTHCDRLLLRSATPTLGRSGARLLQRSGRSCARRRLRRLTGPALVHSSAVRSSAPGWIRARRLRRSMLGLCGARCSRPGCCGARLLQRLAALALWRSARFAIGCSCDRPRRHSAAPGLGFYSAQLDRAPGEGSAA